MSKFCAKQYYSGGAMLIVSIMEKEKEMGGR